jgi:hypothetical protein
MGLEPHETALQRMEPFAINCAYYRHWLKQAIPGKQTVTSVGDIDKDIIIFTSTIKTEIKPQNCIIHTRLETRPFRIWRNPFEEIERQGKKMFNFNRSS